MKPGALITLLITGYLLLAAAQDGALLVWLLVLAPFVLAGIALALDIADSRKRN